MIKVGITGQSGFVGSNLFNYLAQSPQKIHLVNFEDSFFSNKNLLNKFISQCDAIVHLAALSRHNEEGLVYDTNISLVKMLVSGLIECNATPHILFASSIQENNCSEYGKSKYDGRKLLENWATLSGACFTSMVFPNIYGPLAKPYYASFVATFCYELTHNKTPVVIEDNLVELAYIDNISQRILDIVEEKRNCNGKTISVIRFKGDFCEKVSSVLKKLHLYKVTYFDDKKMPDLKNENETNLFNTLQSYIDV